MVRSFPRDTKSYREPDGLYRYSFRSQPNPRTSALKVAQTQAKLANAPTQPAATKQRKTVKSNTRVTSPPHVANLASVARPPLSQTFGTAVNTNTNLAPSTSGNNRVPNVRRRTAGGKTKRYLGLNAIVEGPAVVVKRETSLTPPAFPAAEATIAVQSRPVPVAGPSRQNPSAVLAPPAISTTPQRGALSSLAPPASPPANDSAPRNLFMDYYVHKQLYLTLAHLQHHVHSFNGMSEEEIVQSACFTLAAHQVKLATLPWLHEMLKLYRPTLSIEYLQGALSRATAIKAHVVHTVTGAVFRQDALAVLNEEDELLYSYSLDDSLLPVNEVRSQVAEYISNQAQRFIVAVPT